MVEPLANKTFKCDINWKITLLSVLFFSLLISLGLWQLDRAEQKQTILDDWQKQQELPPLDLTNISWQELTTSALKRKVRVGGVFNDKEYWLLEAKVYHGKVGYQVVMPLVLDTQHIILVNRGWIAASAYREELPTFSTPKNYIDVVGNLIKPEQSSFVSENGGDRQDWPYRLLQIDITKMADQLGFKLVPYVIEIDPENTAALVAEWPKINVTPEKHTGYAVQWFSMAVALFVLWFFANTNITHILRKEDT